MFARFTPTDPHFDPVFLAMAGLLLVLLLWTLLLSARMSSVSRRYRELMSSPSGANLEDLLREYFLLAREAKDIAARAGHKADDLIDTHRACLQRVGVVRFDAFHDTGGQLSFTMAITDDPGNGFVLTSVYGREGCRIYAKGLHNGESETPLSAEEREAVQKALSLQIIKERT